LAPSIETSTSIRHQRTELVARFTHQLIDGRLHTQKTSVHSKMTQYNATSSDRILVTGGAGFLGKRVVEKLRSNGYKNICVPRKQNFDLTEQGKVRQLLDENKPQLIIHLAAVVGGIGANRDNPGKFFYDNLIMGVMLMEEARLCGTEKFVTVGTICSYPKFTPVPFKEDDLWSGYPEETNAPYGLAKKMLLVQSQAYRDQYNFNAIYLMPVNLYGPGDNFDPASSHVIPAMIKKFVEAKQAGAPSVVLWGDGSPTREFLHVDDAARAIVMAAERYNDALPVNLGSGSEISIKDLANLIAKAIGYTGRIEWDTDKPNGQPRRKLDTQRAKNMLGFEAKVHLKDGIQEMVDWYLKESSAQAVKTG
jgi:GDP-L-fucose synthase